MPQTNASDCFGYFERTQEHQSRSYQWKPEARGGPHLRVKSANLPDGQLLATTGEMQAEDLNGRTVTALINAALERGWEPDEQGRDCHWFEMKGVGGKGLV